MADDDLLFSLKSRVVLRRRASRDLFDLWFIVARLGRSTEDILHEMALASPHIGAEGSLARLAPARLPSTDPGFRTSLSDAPRDSAELLERMAELVRDHQRRTARRVAVDLLRRRGE